MNINYTTFLDFAVGLNSIYLPKAICVWASNAGVEPKINIIKGTKNHSIIITIFFNQLTSLGRGGSIIRLKTIQTILVNKVKLKSNPVILERLKPIAIWLKNTPPNIIGSGPITTKITAQIAQVTWLSKR
jgi:hypothetical protein